MAAVLNSPSEEAAQEALDQLSGEVTASTQTVLTVNGRYVRDSVLQHLQSAFCPADLTNASVCLPDTRRVAVWGQGFGPRGHLTSDGTAARVDFTSGGLLAGADTRLGGGWRAGAFGGYGQTDLELATMRSAATSDDYHLGGYAGAQWRHVGVRFGGSYAWNRLESSRVVAIDTLTETLRASYNGGTRQAFGELAYRVPFGRATVDPFANVAYVSLRTDGYRETGGAAALGAQASTNAMTFRTLGVRPASHLPAFTVHRCR